MTSSKRFHVFQPQTMVLYTTLFRDGAGESFVPHEAVKQISAAANAPVFGFLDQFLGHGIVGGKLYSLARQGSDAARVALQIMGGAEPSKLPMLTEGATELLFDWRQLRRWGIDEARLPAGSEVRIPRGLAVGAVSLGNSFDCGGTCSANRYLLACCSMNTGAGAPPRWSR